MKPDESFYVATRMIPHYKESNEQTLFPELYTKVVPASELARARGLLDEARSLIKCDRSLHEAGGILYCKPCMFLEKIRGG